MTEYLDTEPEEPVEEPPVEDTPTEDEEPAVELIPIAFEGEAPEPLDTSVYFTAIRANRTQEQLDILMEARNG